MPLTSTEIMQQINNFLNQSAQKYIIKIGSIDLVKSSLEQDQIREKFKKLIFSDIKEYMESIASLEPTEFNLAAQQLRLLRIGIALDAENNSKQRIGLDCFKELSKVLSIDGVNQELECKLVYVALAYNLSNGGTAQEFLDYALRIREIFKSGGFLPFNILDLNFIKLYYSFCIILASWRVKNTVVHTAYNDFPFNNRLGNIEFEAIVSEAVTAVSDMGWIDLQDKIAIITVYQMISAKCYQEEDCYDETYLKKAIEFAKQSVEQVIMVKNLIADGHKYGTTKEATAMASQEIIDALFPEQAAKRAEQQAKKIEREAFINHAQKKLEYLDQFLKTNLKQCEDQRVAVQQEAIKEINAWVVKAKQDANQKSYETFKIQCAIMATTYVLTPYIAPVISGTAVSLGVSTVTANTIGTAFAPAIAKATVSTTLNAMVNDDYEHLGTNILKSAVISAVPVGIGLTVKLDVPSTHVVGIIKQAVVNTIKGATEAALQGDNILKNTFITVAGGMASDKLLKYLPAEARSLAGTDCAVSAGMHSTVSSLLKNEGDLLMNGLHQAAETFIINQTGNTVADELNVLKTNVGSIAGKVVAAYQDASQSVERQDIMMKDLILAKRYGKQTKEEALRQANAATKEAHKVPEILKEQLTDQQVRDSELLQIKQVELLDRLTQQLNLRARQAANQNGTVINVFDEKGNKIKEVDFNGVQIWPSGPKNRNNFPKNKH